jgi:hypothetical protein
MYVSPRLLRACAGLTTLIKRPRNSPRLQILPPERSYKGRFQTYEDGSQSKSAMQLFRGNLFAAVIRTAQNQLCCYPTTCPHSSRQNRVTCCIESSSSTSYWEMPVSYFTSRCVATLTISKSSLNLWSPRLCFSAGNGWRTLGDDFLYIMRVSTDPLITKLSPK